MNEFLKQIEYDLDNTFFNQNEFAENVKIFDDKSSIEVLGIFEEEEEIVDLYSQVATLHPTLLIKKSELKRISRPTYVEIRNQRYSVSRVVPESNETSLLLLRIR